MIICWYYRYGVNNEPERKLFQGSLIHNSCLINCTRRDISREAMAGGQPEPLVLFLLDSLN